MNFLTILTALAITASAAGSPLSFDRTVFDFGRVGVKDGPLTCTFTATNTSDQPTVIFSVASSCNCTKAEWNRSIILPGKTEVITVVYDNSEGAHPFDKTLTVYAKGAEKPVVLHVRGIVEKKKR